MLKKLIRGVVVGSPLEPLARNLYSRINRSCAESTAEMRDNPQMKEIMRRVLNADSPCLDIGANTGDMLEWITAFAPRGAHHAFEPIPELAGDLVRRFPQVQVHQVALGQAAGAAQFSYVPGMPGHSSLKGDPAEADRSILLDVRVEVLDQLLPADYSPVLVKIDVEGAEYAALRGGVEMLRRSPPLILFEFGQSVERFHVSPAMMHDFICGELKMRISRLNDWLDGRPPLSLAHFERIFRQGLLWNFVAHPQ